MGLSVLSPALKPLLTSLTLIFQAAGCKVQGKTSRYNVCMARHQRGWGMHRIYEGQRIIILRRAVYGEEEREAHYGQGAPPCPPHLTLHPAQDDNAKQATTTQKRHNTAEPLHSHPASAFSCMASLIIFGLLPWTAYVRFFFLDD